MTKNEIQTKVITFQAEWDKYLEKSWDGIRYIYDKSKGAGRDNVVWPWKEAAELGLPNLQGAYWCAIWQFMPYVRIIGLEDAQKLFHQTWYINCQALFDTYKALEKKTGKTFIFKNPSICRIYLHWNGSRFNHTENVIKVSDDGKIFWTNGGNTAVSGAEANGGGIYHMKKYTTSSCIANGDRFVELDWNAITSKDIPELQEYEIKVGEIGLTVSVESSLNIRDYPKTGNVIGTVKNGERIFPNKKVFIMGESWYYLPDKNGWMSAKYLDGGWVCEESISNPLKWWYIHKGYTCTINDIEFIGGKKYLFDEEGYMLENTEVSFCINADGEMSRK